MANTYGRRPHDDDVPSLDYFQRTNGGWVWVICDECGHRRQTAIASFVIRWGPKASSNKLRRSMRCVCGPKSATIQMPGRHGTHVGVEPFPANWQDSRASG